MGKSIKLSNEKRDAIKDDLVKEYKKKIKFEEERTKLVDLITKWFDENLDPDVKKLYDKYQKKSGNNIYKNYNYELFNVQSFTFYLDADNWSYRVEIPNVLIGAYGLFENISTLIPNKSSYAINKLAVVNNISGAREIINSLQDKIKNINQVKSRLNCALSHINTSNQLKAEFPEAYESFKRLFDEDTGYVKPETKMPNRCDDIEGIRAMLQ